VNTNTSLLTLLVLSCAFLTGCNITTGCSSRAIRIVDEPQDVSSQNKVRQLQQELKLAEQRIDLEKKKRESAEERLKKLQEKTDKPDALEKEPAHGS
jgi:septal ring factor EnvC (AmiA/AmiB activator)